MVSSFTRSLLRKILSPLTLNGPYRLKIVFADGSSIASAEGDTLPDVTLVFKTPRAEKRSLLFFYQGVIEAYIDEEIDITGDQAFAKLAEITHAAFPGARQGKMPTNPIMWVRQVVQEARQNNRSIRRAIENAEFHYGLDPRFFELKLGETVGYSEGYWTAGTETLDQAKYNLYEYACRKLRLKPGDRVLEVGSGWGYLPLLMAKKYGAHVTIYNPVQRQNEYMRERFREHGMSEHIELIDKEHRHIAAQPGAFDKFVSIGIQEHAGKDNYRSWVECIATALRPGGIGLISATTFMHKEMTNFLTLKYIFPGGHVPSLPRTLQQMDKCGLSFVEIENLWPHYQKTLAVWRENLDRYWHEIQKLDPRTFNESFRRRWIFYLEGTIEGFVYAIDLAHIVFTKGRGDELYPQDRGIAHREAEFATGSQSVVCYPKT